MSRPILYLASVLPTLSETFVSGELAALRERGVAVLAASVHRPRNVPAEPQLQALAQEVIPIYGAGGARLLWDAGWEALRRPWATFGTLRLVLGDVLGSVDVTPGRRLKVLWQGVAALALARRVRPLRVAHIHAHMAHVPTTLAMYAARQLRIGFSFTGHANDLFPQRTLLPEKLQRAAFVACISHWHRALYQELAGVPAGRLPIVRCGVDLPETPDARPRAARGPSHIVSVGRLVRKKGFDILLEAVAALAARGVDVRCTIVGGGPEEDRLRRQCEQQPLKDRVQLVGPREHAQVQALLWTADLFVLPCRVDSAGDRDGIPVVLMEAMAAGVPVVTGDLPAIRELVRHGETGWCVPPGDPAELAAALERLVADAGLRTQLGLAGRRWVAEEFERGVNVGRLLRAFADAGVGASAPVTHAVRSAGPADHRTTTRTTECSGT